MKIGCGNTMWCWWLVLSVSLGGAYWASLPVGGDAEMQIAIINIEASQVAIMELTSSDAVIVASRREDLADRWWIDVKRTSAASTGPSPSPAPSHLHFMASKKFKDSLGALTPFSAIRVIQKVGDEQLVEFGLKDSKKSLQIKDSAGASLLSLVVGKQMDGSRNTYVLNQANKAVLLIRGELISDFEKSEIGFFERSFMGLDPEEIQSATLIFGEKSLTVSHTKRDTKGAIIWTRAEGDGAPAVSASSWFDRFDQLKAAAYASADEQKRLSASPPDAVVKFVGARSNSEVIEFRKMTNVNQVEYWLTSGYLGWNVKIAAARGEVLLKDLPQVISP